MYTKIKSLQTIYIDEFKQLLAQFSPENIESTLSTPIPDKRFHSLAWQHSVLHHMLAALYLLQTRFLHEMVKHLDTAIDIKVRKRIRLIVNQYTAALSPANFFAMNPDAIKILISTNGNSLQSGILNMLTDLTKGRVSQTDENAFTLDKSIAATPGEVIFENEFFQLLQYHPSCAQVDKYPLLIVPPCINKYYILDLQKNNSFVRYAVAKGLNVFLISWRNPDISMKHASWSDYIEHGVICALKITRDIIAKTAVKTFDNNKTYLKIHTLGFCIGGTMLSMALAVLAERNIYPAATLTLLTTFLDFSHSGDLGALIDEAQVLFYEKNLAGMYGGVYDLMRGVDLSNIFTALKPNDLFWQYVVSHYLKGEVLQAFDLLYWNSDNTNLPGPMYSWFLRNLYLENKLKQAGALEVCGVKIDLRKILAPAFIYGSFDDHIVPWISAYESIKLLKGPCTFVLGSSGHVAGVINSPNKFYSNKRMYWKNSNLLSSKVKHSVKSISLSAKEWLDTATVVSGSWWPEWGEWLAKHAGEKCAAPKYIGSDEYSCLELAPGSYVKENAWIL